MAFQRSWIRRLYDNCFHEWKLIPLYLTDKCFGSSIKFHSSLLFKRNKPNFSHLSIEKLFCTKKKHFAITNEIPSCILSQHLWYNVNIQVNKTSIQFSRFSETNIHYVSQFLNDNGSIKQWHEFRAKYNLHENSYFQWLQLIDSITEKHKFIIKKDYEKATILITHDHHLVKGSRVITLDKLTSTEIYSILIFKYQKHSPSNIYFKNLFNDNDINWAAIYKLPTLVTHNTYMRSFQYKILNNVLFLTKRLHIFGIKSLPLCCFCNLNDETPFHMFYEFDRVKCLWSDLVQCFQNTLISPTLKPQATVLNNGSSFENNNVFIS